MKNIILLMLVVALLAAATLTAQATQPEFTGLKLSHFECLTETTAELHFVLVDAPTSTDYGQVDWTGIWNAAPVAGSAPFTAHTGGVAHYNEVIAITPGSHTLDVQTGSVTVNGITYQLQNPKGYTITCATLGVVLGEFTATVVGPDVNMQWETVSEWDNIGFNLYRSTTENFDDAELIAHIPSPTPGGTVGQEYEYWDYGPGPGNYYYWIKDVDVQGYGNIYGPVTVIVLGPTAVTVASFSAAPRVCQCPVGKTLIAWPCGKVAQRACAIWGK